MELTHYLPGPTQALHLVIAVLTLAGFAVIGGALSGSRRDRLFDFFTGFGAVTGTMTILGVLTDIPFSWMAIGFWLSIPVAAILIWQREGSLNNSKSGLGLLIRIFILSLPILLPVGAMQASQWDEFSQWLFNALYIFKFDAFPQLGLPESSSVLPAYPHGNQLFAYLVSYASGAFVEMSVAFGNVLLLLALAPVYVAMVGFGAKIPPERLMGWFAAALGIMGVTVLSTTFVQKLVFTAYADTSTAVLLAVVSVLLWRLLNDLAEDAGNSLTFAWQFSLACAFFINIKQTNLVLLVFLLLAGFAIALRDRDIPIGKFLRCLPIMLSIPAIVYISWRFHVAENFTGGEFSLMPREKWLVDDAFVILSRMLLVASKKGAYTGMMLAISIAGLWCFCSGRGGRYGRLLFMTGAIFVSYWIFLWAMYIAAFGVYEGLHVASFWRYNVQLGLLGALTSAVALGILYERRVLARLADRIQTRTILAALVVLGVVVTPLAFNYKIRIDLRPQKTHVRLAGQDLSQIIPSGATIAVLDPKGQGFTDQIIRYELLGFTKSDPVPTFLYRMSRTISSRNDMARQLEKHGVTHVWVHQTLDWYAAGFGVSNLRKDGSTLVVKSGDGSWRVEKFWPYDGYTDPYSLPD